MNIIIYLNIEIIRNSSQNRIIQFDPFESLQSILKETLFDYFSIKNKEVSQYKGTNIKPSLNYIKPNLNLDELNIGLRKILEKNIIK